MAGSIRKLQIFSFLVLILGIAIGAAGIVVAIVFGTRSCNCDSTNATTPQSPVTCSTKIFSLRSPVKINWDPKLLDPTSALYKAKRAEVIQSFMDSLINSKSHTSLSMLITYTLDVNLFEPDPSSKTSAYVYASAAASGAMDLGLIPDSSALADRISKASIAAGASDVNNNTLQFCKEPIVPGVSTATSPPVVCPTSPSSTPPTTIHMPENSSAASTSHSPTKTPVTTSSSSKATASATSSSSPASSTSSRSPASPSSPTTTTKPTAAPSSTSAQPCVINADIVLAYEQAFYEADALRMLNYILGGLFASPYYRFGGETRMVTVPYPYDEALSKMDDNLGWDGLKDLMITANRTIWPSRPADPYLPTTIFTADHEFEQSSLNRNRVIFFFGKEDDTVKYAEGYADVVKEEGTRILTLSTLKADLGPLASPGWSFYIEDPDMAGNMSDVIADALLGAFSSCQAPTSTQLPPTSSPCTLFINADIIMLIEMNFPISQSNVLLEGAEDIFTTAPNNYQFGGKTRVAGLAYPSLDSTDPLAENLGLDTFVAEMQAINASIWDVGLGATDLSAALTAVEGAFPDPTRNRVLIIVGKNYTTVASAAPIADQFKAGGMAVITASYDSNGLKPLATPGLDFEFDTLFAYLIPGEVNEALVKRFPSCKTQPVP